MKLENILTAIMVLGFFAAVVALCYIEVGGSPPSPGRSMSIHITPGYHGTITIPADAGAVTVVCQ